MKKSLLIFAALFASHSAFAYNVVERRFSVEGPRAEALYNALAADPRADISDDIAVEISGGVECKASTNACVTFTHDGDEKRLSNGAAIYGALQAVGANLSVYLSTVECSRGYYAKVPTKNYTCRITERLSGN